MGCLFTSQIHLSGIGFKGFPNRISAEISELGKCALNKYILSSGSHLDNSSISMLTAGMGLLVIALTIFPVVIHICTLDPTRAEFGLQPVSQEVPAHLLLHTRSFGQPSLA